MHYALKITDEDNYIIVEHLANYSDDTVHTDIDELPQQEWRIILSHGLKKINLIGK